MLTELRFALRQIAKFPGYTATVVLTLAFGIAVNTQIFAIVSAFFLQPMPVRDPDRLTVIVERNDLFNLPLQISFLDFQDIRAGSKALTDHVAFFPSAAHVGVKGRSPERVWIEAVTPDAFSKLGVGVALGRPLQPSDGEMPPGTPVAVLTHRYWQNHFGSDPGLIGSTVQIDGKPFTIVGVGQPGFEGFAWSMSVSLFVPSGTLPLLRAGGADLFKYRSAIAWRVLAYLRPGATIAEANAELDVFAKRFGKDFPDEPHNLRFQAVLEQHARPDPSAMDFAPVFSALFAGLVVMVLLIACANVANLMSAHALSRERELVVRAALGATRTRLIRQLLIESLVLAVIAGFCAYWLVWWGGDSLRGLMSQGDIPVRQEHTLGWRVWIFTGVISLVAGIASGLFPALRCSRVDLNEGLKQGGRHTAGGGHRMRNLLVGGQVAASCVVLIASAQFLRGLQACRDLNLGFRADRLIMVSFDLGLQGYDQARGLRFQKQLLERVEALPGVESAGFTQHVPFGNNIMMRQHWPDNPTAPVPDGHINVAFSAVTPGFVKMLGIPLLRGRDLVAQDNDERAPLVAVINDAMAKAFWPGANPIGQHFHRDWQGGPPIEVVGVVATGKYVMLTEAPRPYYYTPFAQFYGMPASLVVRTAGSPYGLASSLREAVRQLDSDLPIYSLLTFDEHMASSALALMPLRAGATLAGVQGAIGLLLAILGLYAVVSYGVTSRTREIGVRMALGATGPDVLRLVAREGLRLTLTGLGVGLAFALGLSFILSRVLFGVHTVDTVAFPAVITLLVATAAFACWLPARRATRVDPVIALRAE